MNLVPNQATFLNWRTSACHSLSEQGPVPIHVWTWPVDLRDTLYHLVMAELLPPKVSRLWLMKCYSSCSAYGKCRLQFSYRWGGESLTGGTRLNCFRDVQHKIKPTAQTESGTVHQDSSMPSDTVGTHEVWLTLSMNINSWNERYCRSEHHSALHAVSLPNTVRD